jgi:hypothetical protein
MTKCRGESMRATKDVENNISIRATFPSSLLNIFAKGSVWYILNPREVPGRRIVSQDRCREEEQRTNSKAAVVLVEGHKIHRHCRI